MRETMESTSDLLYLIYPLIGSVDPELEKFLVRSNVGVMFALSWLITWYGHVLPDFRQVGMFFLDFQVSFLWLVSSRTVLVRSE